MSQQYESRYKGQQYSEQEYSGSSNFVQQEELEDYYRRWIIFIISYYDVLF